MGSLSGFVGQGGVMIAVKVMQTQHMVKHLKRAGLPFATPLAVFVQVDTGASMSVLDGDIIARMNLLNRGQVPIHTPSTGPDIEYRDQYDVAIVIGEDLPDPLVSTVTVIESEFASRGFHGLIGRDILRRCELHYHGPQNRFTLSW